MLQQGASTLDGASYTYDLAGNRKSKTNLLNSAVSNFNYDNVYQLTGVTGPNPESYTYDPVGNRLTSQSISNFAQGLGVQQDVAEAIKRFEAVARPSDSSDAFAARIELGRVFANGLGIPVDKNLARKWYSAAVEVATEADDPDEVGEAREYLNE